jgi:bifunctional pyridoxal-dependent enzyme with beta-cystathionase and maltose regulon repressor activities
MDFTCPNPVVLTPAQRAAHGIYGYAFCRRNFAR